MMTSNAIGNELLMGYVERVELLEAEKKDRIADIRVVYAEAKANGLTPKYIREVIKRRAKRPADVAEDDALRDMYFTAAGLNHEAPLFRHVGQMAVDLTARQQVIDAFKKLVPKEGDIVITMGGQKVKLYRDENGEAHAVDVIERPAAAKPASSSPAQRPRAEVPDVDAAGAEQLGRKAAKDNVPIVENPFPWDDDRRSAWDRGWRAGAGSDGMGPEEE